MTLCICMRKYIRYTYENCWGSLGDTKGSFRMCASRLFLALNGISVVGFAVPASFLHFQELCPGLIAGVPLALTCPCDCKMREKGALQAALQRVCEIGVVQRCGCPLPVPVRFSFTASERDGVRLQPFSTPLQFIEIACSFCLHVIKIARLA